MEGTGFELMLGPSKDKINIFDCLFGAFGDMTKQRLA